MREKSEQIKQIQDKGNGQAVLGNVVLVLSAQTPVCYERKVSLYLHLHLKTKDWREQHFLPSNKKQPQDGKWEVFQTSSDSQAFKCSL